MTKYGPVSFVSSRPSHASLQRTIRIQHKHGSRGRKGNIGTKSFERAGKKVMGVKLKYRKIHKIIHGVEDSCK